MKRQSEEDFVKIHEDQEQTQLQREIMKNVDALAQCTDDVNLMITDLDKKLDKVLKKQEHDYLKAYSIYVKEKEKDLRTLITKLNEKNSNNSLKDDLIFKLKQDNRTLTEQQEKQSEIQKNLNKTVQIWQVQCDEHKKDANFLREQIFESKRQNKVLKLAISRLQEEIAQKDGVIKSIDQSTFLTQPKQQNVEEIYDIMPSQIDSAFEQSKIQQQSKIKISDSQMSRYNQLPTVNVKFEKFIDVVFNSKMQTVDMKDQIIKYVQALETSYTDAVRELRSQLEKEKKKQKIVSSEKINAIAEQNDIENLFVECVEEVRKDIMKRRLKHEIYNKKKYKPFDPKTEEAKDFEDSLLKLAQLAKDKVRQPDFTAKDKCNLLDLFVNNEKTLLKIYEALFPHRVSTSVTAGIEKPLQYDKLGKSGQNYFSQHLNTQSIAKSQDRLTAYKHINVSQMTKNNNQWFENYLEPKRKTNTSQQVLPRIQDNAK